MGRRPAPTGRAGPAPPWTAHSSCARLPRFAGTATTRPPLPATSSSTSGRTAPTCASSSPPGSLPGSTGRSRQWSRRLGGGRSSPERDSISHRVTKCHTAGDSPPATPRASRDCRLVAPQPLLGVARVDPDPSAGGRRTLSNRSAVGPPGAATQVIGGSDGRLGKGRRHRATRTSGISADDNGRVGPLSVEGLGSPSGLPSASGPPVTPGRSGVSARASGDQTSGPYLRFRALRAYGQGETGRRCRGLRPVVDPRREAWLPGAANAESST